MLIELTAGTCSAQTSPCTGMTVAECPNGYIGTNTKTGPPLDCAGTGVGVSARSRLVRIQLMIAGDHHILSVMIGWIKWVGMSRVAVHVHVRVWQEYVLLGIRLYL